MRSNVKMQSLDILNEIERKNNSLFINFQFNFHIQKTFIPMRISK